MYVFNGQVHDGKDCFFEAKRDGADLFSTLDLFRLSDQQQYDQSNKKQAER